MTLADIIELIRKGDMAQAKKKLASVLKNKKLSGKDRIYLSAIYKGLGQIAKGIKALGKELSLKEMMIATEVELQRQIRLANLVNHHGAKYVARRIFGNLEKVINERDLSLQRIEPYYYNYLANHLLDHGEHDKAKEYCLKAQQKMNVEGPTWPSYQFTLARIALNMERSEDAVAILNRTLEVLPTDKKLLRAICLTRKGLAYFQMGKYHEALEYFKQSDQLSGDLSSGGERSFLYRAWGGTLVELGNYQEAREKLEKALTYMNPMSLHPEYFNSTVYWLWRIPGYKLSQGKLLSLILHPVISDFSYLAGRLYREQEAYYLPPFYKNKITNRSNDCLFVSGESMTPMDYLKNKVFQLYSGKNVLDLYSGISIDGKTGELSSFTELQSACLYAIICSGEVGISRWVLADCVYQQNFYNSSTGEQRLNQLILELRKIGFDIQLSDNIYSLDYNKDNQIMVLPMFKGLQKKSIYLQAQSESFARTDLENVFSIKPSTAKSWIKKWEEEKLITVQKQGKNTTYRFSA